MPGNCKLINSALQNYERHWKRTKRKAKETTRKTHARTNYKCACHTRLHCTHWPIFRALVACLAVSKALGATAAAAATVAAIAANSAVILPHKLPLKYGLNQFMHLKGTILNICINKQKNTYKYVWKGVRTCSRATVAGYYSMQLVWKQHLLATVNFQWLCSFLLLLHTKSYFLLCYCTRTTFWFLLLDKKKR